MNLSKCVRSLIMQVGIYGLTLPFVDQNKKAIPTEVVLHDVLTNVTIPEYSEFVPWTREGEIEITKLQVIDEKLGIYMLPAFLTLTDVKDVIDVHMPYYNQRGTFGDIAPAYGINRSVQGVATSQAYMMLAGQMRSEPTFEYLGNNKIRLYGYPKTTVAFKVSCDHEPNGESIPDSCYDSFMELATLDVKQFLYNSLKLYDGIQTAFGEVKLKTEDYQSAESDRKALLDQWRDLAHLDGDESFEWM